MKFKTGKCYKWTRQGDEDSQLFMKCLPDRQAEWIPVTSKGYVLSYNTLSGPGSDYYKSYWNVRSIPHYKYLLFRNLSHEA